MIETIWQTDAVVIQSLLAEATQTMLDAICNLKPLTASGRAIPEVSL